MSRRVSTLAVLMVAGAVMSGCVEEQVFFIQQNQVPKDGCQIDTDESTARSRGTLDVSVGRGYELFPLIQMDVASSATDNQPERNRFQLREFRITLDLSDVPNAVDMLAALPADQRSRLTNFSQPTSGVLGPGDTFATHVTIIPSDLVKVLQVPQGGEAIVVAGVRLAADRLGTSTEMESTTFYFPVTLCNGCLVQSEPTCPTPDEINLLNTNVCGLPQDAPVVCCPRNNAVVCCDDQAKCS